MNVRRYTYAIAVLIALHVAIALWLILSPIIDEPDQLLISDVKRYEKIEAADGMAYRDFAVEYPPVTLLNITTIATGDLQRDARLLVVSQLACDLLVVGAMAWGFGRRAACAYLVLSSAMLVYPFIYFRTDLLSVALAAWGLALVHRNRERTGGVVLAVACFAKLWPLALIPWLAARRRVPTLVAMIGSGVIGLVAWVGVTGTQGVRDVVSFRGATGWQIESFPGALMHFIAPESVAVENGAWRSGEMWWWTRGGLMLCMLATFVAVGLLVQRTNGRHREIVDALAPLAALAGFIVFAPIISPQYMIWLAPFGALAWVAGARRAAIVVGAVMVLSSAMFAQVKQYIYAEPQAVALLWVRNGLLAVLLVGTLHRLWAIAREAHADRPAPPATESPLVRL